MTDWFLAHREAKKQLSSSRQRNDEITSFVNYLWPVSLEYHSPLNPLFLADYAAFQSAARPSVTLARDGLVPLLWFFQSNPEPLRSRSGRLLVEESLGAYVPPAWRPSTGTYSLAASDEGTASSSSRRGLLLLGVMMDTYCSIRHLEKLMDRLVATVGKNELRRREIVAFLPGRFDGWGNEHRHEFHLEYMARLHETLGTKVKALSWTELEARSSYEGFDVVDLNEGLLWSDNFLMHLTMGRGAQPLWQPSRAAESGSQFVALSSHHGYRISPKVTAPYGLAEDRGSSDKKARFLANVSLAMRSEANGRFPWPAWFSDWARGKAGAAPASASVSASFKRKRSKRASAGGPAVLRSGNQATTL